MSDPAATVVTSGTPSPPDAGSSVGGHIDMTTTSSRSERINLRATPQEVSLLRQAAAKSGLTLTTFMLTISLQQASMILGQSNEQDS